VQQYLYDGLGRLGREIRLMSSTSASPYALRLTGYDGVGNVSFVSEWAGCSTLGVCGSSSPSAGTSTSSFDPDGRPLAIRKADGAITTISYADGASSLSNTQKSVTLSNINGSCSNGCTGGSSSTTTHRYDAFGRLVSVAEPGGDVTSYSYDVSGKLTQVSQGVQTRSYSYDSAGFQRSETTPEKGTVTYDNYGSLGNLLSETEPGGLVVNRTYDFAGRLTGVVSGGLRYLTNCFDGRACADGTSGYAGGAHPLGKLTRRIGFNPQSPTAPAVTDDLDYSDPAGRLSGQTTTIAGGNNLSVTQRWSYNGLGLLAHHDHPRPGGAPVFAVSTIYDAGLPVAEYVNGIPMVSGVARQASGALSSYTTGIGIGHDVTTTISQDASSLLPRASRIATTAQGAASPVFDTLGYSYDGAGNITSVGSDSFSYDPRSRLVTANLSGAGSQAYSYDRYGNLLAKGPNVFCSGTCANNQISGAGYLRGNLTSYAGQGFAWDGLDRMISNQSPNLTWSYLYDAGGERVAKIPPSGAWTFTIRDAGKQVTTEYSGTTVSRDNVFLGNQLVLSYANTAVGGSGPAWTFYASDHLGTPRLISDAAGNPVETRRYWPFGDAVAAQGSFETLRFATMEFDAEGGTGSSLAGDRYYDHSRSHVGGLARFLCPDELQGKPIDPQSWNRYAYSGNNPLIFLDPNGREKYWAEQVASAGIAAGSSMQSVGASLNNGRPIGIAADFLVSTAGSMIQGTGDLFNLGTSTGEALGAGEDSFNTTLAVSQDVGRLGGWILAIAGSGAAAEARFGGSTELVQRAMSNSELQATHDTGLIRGGREGTHFVSDHVNSDPLRARQRLSLYKTPEARATLQVKKGVFGPETRVKPANNMPGGGMERTATGKVKVKVVGELQYEP
jgi:RHS repeat-associated protein